MAAGDLELQKASEEVGRRNAEAVIAYAKETRRMFRELEAKVQNLENTVRARDEEIVRLRGQVAHALNAISAGGTQ